MSGRIDSHLRENSQHFSPRTVRNGNEVFNHLFNMICIPQSY